MENKTKEKDIAMVDLDEDLSYLDIFINLTINIPLIWEKIIINLSGGDVADCLKVNKGLRSILAQCLVSNSRLRSMIDVSATARAVSNRRFRSVTDVKFKQNECAVGWCLKIDGNWYYITGKYRVANDFIKLGPMPSRGLRHLILSEEDRQGKPSCARYKVSWQGKHFGNDRKSEIFLSTFDTSGNYAHDIKLNTYLYIYENYRHHLVRHSGSNEEAKVLIILPRNKIAVHETLTGKSLWQHELCADKEVIGSCFSFITKYFCGYATATKSIRNTVCTLNVFDTNSGDFIGSVNIRGFSTNVIESPAWKGNYLVYIYSVCDMRLLRVIKVKEHEVTQYEFPLPLRKIMQLNENDEHSRDLPVCSTAIIGFLGKSNILLGQVRDTFKERCYLFSLDLDAALASSNQDEINSAFTYLLTSTCMSKVYKDEQVFQPVYRTDRAKEQVELVGVTTESRNTNSDDKIFKTYMFVTEIHLPSHL